MEKERKKETHSNGLPQNSKKAHAFSRTKKPIAEHTKVLAGSKASKCKKNHYQTQRIQTKWVKKSIFKNPFLKDPKSEVFPNLKIKF